MDYTPEPWTSSSAVYPGQGAAWTAAVATEGKPQLP